MGVNSNLPFHDEPQKLILGGTVPAWFLKKNGTDQVRCFFFFFLELRKKILSSNVGVTSNLRLYNEALK
jgi:hypothetical protein